MIVSSAPFPFHRTRACTSGNGAAHAVALRFLLCVGPGLLSVHELIGILATLCICDQWPMKPATDMMKALTAMMTAPMAVKATPVPTASKEYKCYFWHWKSTNTNPPGKRVQVSALVEVK